MLEQIGYKKLNDPGEAPWTVVDLSGGTNQELVTGILDWFAVHDFWDSAAVERVYEEGGTWKALVRHDYQAFKNTYAIYDAKHDSLYIRKEISLADGGKAHGFIRYGSGKFGISGSTVRVPEQSFADGLAVGDPIADAIQTNYQPLYETYQPGEYLLDENGDKIPEMELVYTCGEVTESHTEEILTEIPAAYDKETKTYQFHRTEKAPDQPVTTDYRIITRESSMEVDGAEMPYNDHLIRQGASVTAWAPAEEPDAGSYVRSQILLYPGQLQVCQDGGTRTEPVRVWERVIKQAIQVTKDIARDSYDKHNTYKVHRDPFTVLFGGYLGEGRKYVSGFHFKAYLVSDLVKAGLLEQKEDGTWDYKKLFEDESRRTEFDVYAVEWDDPKRDKDGDLTTLHAVEGNGLEPYSGRSVPLPYGTYVVVEQIPKELVNKHYELDEPRQVEIPFVPEIDAEGNVQETVPSNRYLYWADMTPEELAEKYLIRFNEETDVIRAHNHDGDFEVYKYGLDRDLHREDAVCYGRSTSEDAGREDGVYYQWLYDQDGNVVDYGMTRNDVATMTGKTTAFDGKYAKALVPWSVLDPRYGEVIDDVGTIGNREPGLDKAGDFNYVAFSKTHMENTWYSSKLRIEKLDSETGENIIHDGALFKIYLASRDVQGNGPNAVAGTGNVSYITKTVTGTRTELEARGDVDGITWDETARTFRGTVTEPDYDRMELVTMLDTEGKEVGIFRAFSTEREIMKEDGTIEKEPVGYIQTYQPLGAGTYVLVEVQAPEGYQKSKPIAFEVYRDQVTYYEEGDPDKQTEAERYQYVVPLTTTEETVYEDVSRIEVKDSPSKLFIHKVEDGDRSVGDENGLDGLTGVNDKGDLLTYQIRGRKEYLEARGDVEDISWDPVNKEYYGTVTKRYDEWSEDLIAGTEAELLAQKDVKVLYDARTGAFSGFGLRFGIPVSGAELTLYEGLQVERDGNGGYQGVSVAYEPETGKVSRITASETGTHLEITTNETDTTPPYYPIWDTEAIQNPPIEVVFYDLETVDTEIDPDTGETWILDERGNRICLADPDTGMAYTYDDYGNLIVYEADEHGEKKTAQSIEIHEDGTTESIYIDIDIQEDEVGLPLYYKDGKVTYREEVWTSDGTAREISRLPFGAYILEETKVPYDQGYIQSPAMGLVLRESREEQHFYFQNAFTKTDLAKIDVTTKEEIQDAGMSLYRAKWVEDDSERGYHLEKQDIYREWISGYQYDDNGSLKLIHGGEKVGTTEPHWIDHIPVGDYILEETRVPYEWGYVQSDPVEIRVLETGEVQTFVMEDDYTSIELRKYDGKTGEVLDDEHKATLSLYRAVLDENGQPLFKTTKDIPGTQIAVYDPDSKIVTWETGSGADVRATGRLVTDEYGDTRMVYDYNVSFVSPQPDIRQARYYITETGTTRFDYLPVGHYVLVEEETPKGYATAVPQLITVEEKGHLEEIQLFAMEDRPLILEVSKTDMAAGTKEARDAHMAVYPVVDGKRSEDPAYTWISGSDGIYTEEDQAEGRIPFGFSVGDLRLHRIEYIPAGDYVLVEETTPYGFLQAVEIPFTVMDTGTVQGVEMIDEIPDGILTVVKHDADQPETLLPGATFTLSNKDTGKLLETVTTGADGRAQFKPIPIGRMVDGRFAAYTYVAEEVDAPDNYMLNTGKYEFQFTYMDEKTPEIHLTYDAVDQQNQARIAKKDMEGNALAGARLKVVDKATGQVVIDEWTTSQQDYYITGIPVGEYTLIEVETPGKGYALAEPMDFTVTENMTEPVYVEMVDPSSRMEVEKVAAGSDRLLAGAKLQLWKRSETGSAAQDLLIREWTSKEDGAEVFLGLEPGIYYIHEISAPAGYQLGEDMEVVVEDTGDIQVFRYENRKKSGGGGTTDPAREWISFIKVSDTGEYLAGAEFTFYRPDGSILAVETTDSHGRVIILKPEPGTYTFRETKAPDGYQQLERIYSFTITESGEVTGDYQVVNYKIGRKVGRITAFYRSKLNGSGDASLTYPGKLPKTGEEGNDMGVSVHVILSAAAVLLLAVWLGKRRKKVFRGSMMILLTVGFSLGIVSAAYAGESYTEEKIYQTTNEKDCSSEYARTQFSEEKTMESGNFQLSDVTVEVLKEELLPGKGFLYRTPAFADDVENHIPDEVMERGGQTYRLYQYQVLDDWVQERTSEVEGTITYTEVEYTDIIPGEGEITVTDKITGESREERLPLLSYTEGNHYWSQDFSFPVKVTDYDADVFVIGDQEVPASDNLYPYRGELLNSLGLSQEHYRVHYIDWVSEPYTDQGILCRDAVARGEKLVYDAEAVYGGSVTWEAAPGKSISAVYVSESDETSVNYTVRAVGTYLPQEETEENWGTMLKAWLTEHALVISFGLLLFFFFIWALWIWRKAKKEEEMEEGWD
ncbi:MAG: SpaA isopeptide-forming pilin-related protein [Lachnospiraceae bacterium]